MVRCMIRSHNQQYKLAPRTDDAEDMCGAKLEPDPRYEGCCSNVFRPGRVVRDVIVGFLVVLAIAVVIAVLFVVCYYLLPGPIPVVVPSTPFDTEGTLEAISAPSPDITNPTMPTEHTVISEDADVGTEVEVMPSESESNVIPSLPTTVQEELHEESGRSPLLDAFSPHPETPIFFPEALPKEQSTELPQEEELESTLKELPFPEEPTEEVEKPTLPETLSEHHFPITNEEEAPITDVPVEEPATIEETPLGTCRPRQLEMCSNLSYALTALPNWANDQNDVDLREASLPFFQDVIVRSRCSPRAQEYACAILEPPCTPDGTILPPCRTFCRSVASTCQEFVISGVGLSNVFNCERFPHSTDPAVCFDMTQAPGGVVSVGDVSILPQLPSANIPQDTPIAEDYATGGDNFPNEEYSVADYPDYEVARDIPVTVDYPNTGFNRPAVEFSSATEDYPAVSEDYPSRSLDYPNSNVDYPAETQPLASEHTEFFDEEEATAADVHTDFFAQETINSTESFPGEATQNFGSGGDFAPPTSPQILCDHDKFQCQDGSDCVAMAAVCDGIQQCRDSSDEFNCTHIELNTSAIPLSTPIETQTPFSSDVASDITSVPEEDTTTHAPLEETTIEPVTLPPTECPELECLDGTCISLSQLNNGVNDCADGTDEMDFGL